MPDIEANQEEKYQVLHLSKGAVVNECVRCGAVVFHRMIHDAWHETNDRWEESVQKLLFKFSKRIRRLNDFMHGRTNEKNAQQDNRQNNRPDN